MWHGFLHAEHGVDATEHAETSPGLCARSLLHHFVWLPTGYLTETPYSLAESGHALLEPYSDGFPHLGAIISGGNRSPRGSNVPYLGGTLTTSLIGQKGYMK